MGGKWFIPRPQDAPSGRFMALGESHIAESYLGILAKAPRFFQTLEFKNIKKLPKKPTSTAQEFRLVSWHAHPTEIHPHLILWTHSFYLVG